MTRGPYDVVIVGARCAGTALATWLARDGATVALLDAGPAGTDQVISTHTVHPGGMDLLDELGVGEAVRAQAPPAKAIRFDVDGAHVDALGRINPIPPSSWASFPRDPALTRRLASESEYGVNPYELCRSRASRSGP